MNQCGSKKTPIYKVRGRPKGSFWTAPILFMLCEVFSTVPAGGVHCHYAHWMGLDRLWPALPVWQLDVLTSVPGRSA